MVPSNSIRKRPTRPNVPSNFLGVFLVGLLLLGITANYYLNKEAGEDREARSRRIATEMNQLRQVSSSIESRASTR